MSMTTPPGWYPDPSVPSLERWWDGTAWTEHTRAPQPDQQQTGFGPPPAVGTPGPGDASGRAKVIALTVAGVVLVAAIVTGVVVLGKDDDNGGEAKNGGSSSAPASASDPAGDEPGDEATDAPADDSTDEPSESPNTSADDSGRLVDQLNGITLPILDGWEKPDHTVGAELTMRTKEIYDCPGGTGYCYHGTVTSSAADSDDGDTAKEVAETDISDWAEKAYGEDGIGRKPHGGLTSTKKIAAGQVAVAGRSGYFVRWQVKTGAGPGGYVQSLVFPSTIGTESLVVVRFAFDAGSAGPKLSRMDEITKDIRPIGDSGGGTGGVGSSIGPS
ncbi:DUF2510 domain-containing protein [Streptomyces sp. O3]